MIEFPPNHCDIITESFDSCGAKLVRVTLEDYSNLSEEKKNSELKRLRGLNQNKRRYDYFLQNVKVKIRFDYSDYDFNTDNSERFEEEILNPVNQYLNALRK